MQWCLLRKTNSKSALPPCHGGSISEVRSILYQHARRVSGLWTDMAYFSGWEYAALIFLPKKTDIEHGIENHKIKIAHACNENGSHVVCYSKMFLNGPIKWSEVRCMSQKKKFIDSNGFNDWLNYWYSEVTSRAELPCLVIIDNWGWYESEINEADVRVEILLPSTTCK